jgi:hypothetical protein
MVGAFMAYPRAEAGRRAGISGHVSLQGAQEYQEEARHEAGWPFVISAS